MIANVMPVPWIDSPPRTLKEKADLLRRKKHYLRSPTRKGRFLRALFAEVEAEFNEGQRQARLINPLAFFKPSFEQALILNAHLYGIAFVAIYSANRIGKTVATFINFLLWIFPNDPDWPMFKPYTDHLGRRVRVLPRPDISSLKRINDLIQNRDHQHPRPAHIPTPDPRKPHYNESNHKFLQWLQSQLPEIFVPAFPDPPWDKGGTVWFGAPDQDHHEQVMFPLWKEYIPSPSLDRYVVTDREITIRVPHPEGATHTHTIWEIIGKSYESKDTKWSSGAVDAILLTEGITPAIFNEARLRFKDPGIGSHDFTPYLPANSGAASALAQRIAKGKENIPVPYFVFTKFRVYDAPDHIISEDKKRELIKTYEAHAEGKARLEGEFYASSMLVLSHLDRQLHLLPWTKEELFARYPTGRIYRSLDPGLDHPTAIAWALLLPINTWVFYRIFSQQGLVITERVQKAIELSNNSRARIQWGPKKEDYYWRETHPNPNSEIPISTVCDWHTFKQDEVTGRAFSLNYIIQGLNIIPSVHIGPEQRAQTLDDLLLPSKFIPSLLTHKPPAPRVYFLQNEPGIMDFFLKMEEHYWQRKKSGDDRGQPKDKVPEHGDDELDTVTQLTSSPFRWTKDAPRPILIGDSEPEEHLIQASMQVRRLNVPAYLDKSNTFATIAKPTDREVVFFGGNPSESVQDEHGDDYD